MRFKDLTIHVTLGSLSVIALVALALLPITSGICEGEFYEGSWTRSNNNTQASYNAKHYGKHWSISAAIDARGVNASVSVSPFDIWDWTVAERLEGTATITAYRGDCTVWDTYTHSSWGAYDCDSQLLGFCLGHLIQRIISGSGDIKTTERGPDVTEGDSIVLDVQITTHTATMGKANSKTEGGVVDAVIGLDLPVGSLPMGAGVKATYKNESVETISTSFQVTGYKKATANQTGTGRSVYVSRLPNLRGRPFPPNSGATSASADFSFEEASSDASVYD